MKKKILLVSNMYPSQKYPHYGVFVRNSKEILEQSGYQVDISVMKKEDSLLKKIFAYLFFFFGTLFKCMHNYDAVYAHYASHVALPLLIGRAIKKTPIFLNVHGNDVVPEDDHDRRFMGFVNKLVKNSRFIVCPSEYYYNVMRSDFKVEPERLCVYPSGGVDTSYFEMMDRSEARRELGITENKRYIGYAGRFEKCKGWDIFLEACSRILNDNSDIDLIVAGSGSEERSYASMVERLKMNDRIVKYDLVSQKQLKVLYNAMDVFVFPTYRKSESLGLVGLEAMACETITVLPDKFGPSCYGIDSVNSIVFKSGSIESLCEAIKTALELNGSEAEILRKNARKTAEKYDSRNTKHILLELFERQL